MKKVGFIGACDKTNLIMYVAKTLDTIGKKVIVVDTTITQKMKYVVPAINPTRSYITEFENTDYAVGFQTLNDLSDYIGVWEKDLQYDYMLIDIDSYKAIEGFELDNTGNNYFVSSFDMYSLRRGVQILKNLQEPMNLSRILCDYNIREEDEEYLDFLSMETKVTWNDFSIYIPVTGFDKQAMEENQRVYKLRIKRLSANYIEGVFFIVQDIEKDININRLKKIIKE